MSEPSHIHVQGSTVHNLQNVEVSVPRDALVVFTGVSGSGKSSLAFDTIYKEGQRRFMESLSSYARQFLGQMERPEVDRITGVSPTLSIDQKTVNRNPRSTVGTVTEIYDHLRLWMARLGTPHCPKCKAPIQSSSVDAIVDEVLGRGAGKRVLVLGPLIRERKGEYRKELEDLRRDGWARVRVDGQVYHLDESIQMGRYEKHTIEVVVDRLKPSEEKRGRLAESIERAVAIGAGTVGFLVEEETWEFSTLRACQTHPEVSIPELEPRLFSFNAPQGACPGCNGLGSTSRFDVETILDRGKTLPDAFLAFNPQGKLPFSHLDREVLVRVAKGLKLPTRKRLKLWSADEIDRLLYGDPSYSYETRQVRDSGRIDQRTREWLGLMGLMERIWHFTHHKGFQPFRIGAVCDACDGTRLHAVARSVTYRGKNICQWTGLSIAELREWFGSLQLDDQERMIGELLLTEVRDRLQFLDDVGLGYLSLDRGARTLSGGEAQRIRLASQVGSALQGVTYVLDEPSIGLHPRDNAKLLQTLFRLRDRGNSVLVVEHDEATILAADHVVDVGPAAGQQGGHIVFSAPPDELLRSKGLTAEWLRGERCIAVPETRRSLKGKQLKIRGAHRHNLQDVDVSFPLGTLTAVTGVSGSGKSTLVFGVLMESLQTGKPVDCKTIKGLSHIDKLVRISQTPIGRTPRSNPATYVGAFDVIRGLFASTSDAKERGWAKGRFSFNVKGGRCETCSGAGVKQVEMQFLPSVQVPCEVCRRRRFNEETLEIRWKKNTIHDVLQMTVSEAFAFFEAIPKLNRIFQTLLDVGLGYLPIGQPSTTLSGGEAQRIKLARELHKPATGQTLYLLDEPTTGLHLHDVSHLLQALQRLVDAGNTVIVIEHHGDLIKCADFLIDMGPEGGDGGGMVVGAGSPEKVATCDTPTGRVLSGVLGLTPKGVASRPSSVSKGPNQWDDSGRSLRVRGARKNNLQGIDVVVPHNQLTVITGVSGSGKSSLAFDTIFSEGQRRYVESLSTYARRFLGRLQRAPVEQMEGLRPAVAIDQKTTSRNPRSTVATMTEIHDVLRLLYARAGTCHCPKCGVEVRSWSPSQVADFLARSKMGLGWLTAQLPPVKRAVPLQQALIQEGWVRLLDADNTQVLLEDSQSVALLEAGATLVIDRFNPAEESRNRMAEAVRSAFSVGRGRAGYRERKGSRRCEWVELAACTEHGPVLLEPLEPRNFSHNSRLGACLECQGLGAVRGFVRSLMFPAQEAGFWEALDGRVAAILRRSARNRALIEQVFAHLGVGLSVPVRRWSEKVWSQVMDGIAGELTVHWERRWARSSQRVEERMEWGGLRGILNRWKSPLQWLIDMTPCAVCRGGRLQAPFLAVRVAGTTLNEFVVLTVSEALEASHGFEFTGETAVIAARPLLEIQRRLQFLSDVGLGYLSLDRSAVSLSGGESQRIRLASQLGSSLTGVIYVLDEPTIGLHAADTDQLLTTLEGLRDAGNTVILVEHDLDTIRRADQVIDLGPGAGKEGGRLIGHGSPAELCNQPESVTGRWLAGVERMDPPRARRKGRSSIQFSGLGTHNLQIPKVKIPTGVWVGVSGVSGSGKSSLVMDSLAAALKMHLAGEQGSANWKRFKVGETVDRLVVVDQTPIGRTPRSTPATYCKLLGPIRELFAGTLAAQERGFKPLRFSYNGAVGRCVTCEGRGVLLFEMHFLPDVWTECPDCKGTRYNRETLEVRWRGKSIADVLKMRADEALAFFINQRKIVRGLQALVDVGLGYLELGQPATTLSGGEAQRIKLAAELSSRRGHCVYLLDEPTTGLHLQDVRRLVGVLHRLVEKGHTVITVEHHLDVLWQCDVLLDLGPGGGEDGGRIVGAGTPESVARKNTPTGMALRGAAVK